jgi:flavocytochrome c
LRALKKASFLYDYDIRTGDIVQDETASVLLKRLLDSSILQSCSSVFDAFDESLMFQERNEHVVSLQQNFKGVFHNISSILDCVQCQQCKLHGKMAMLGYGAALKVLFMKSPGAEALERNEIVALINTVAKYSESIREVRELTQLYWSHEQADWPFPGNDVQPEEGAASPSPSDVREIVSVEAVDIAVGLAASLGRQGLIDFEQEKELVEKALQRDPDLLILARHYASDADKFLALAGLVPSGVDGLPDVIVVGTGLAGLSAALNVLDRGGSVVMVEKEHLVGGNSNKASSGINAYCSEDGPDALDVFRNDTIRSAGSSARLDLIETLVSRSADAVEWLKSRAGVDLSLLAQLGGHSSKRTHRPSNGMAGAEIIYGIQKAVRAYEKSGSLTLMVDTKVTELLTDDTGRVTGVRYQSAIDPDSLPMDLHAENVVLATGGFASDRSAGSFLGEYRPELLKLPTTAGAFSTGDGVKLATALGAGMVDMDKVQIHPTGWVNPSDPENGSKMLAAELMRGVGGILLNKAGVRFCNELGTRAYVTDQMLAHNAKYNATREWDPDAPPESFSLILSSSAASDGQKHVDLYSHKGLMTRLEGVAALADWMGLPKSTVAMSLQKYQQVADTGLDEFSKTSFRGVPQKDLETEVFYAGTVTPVLHYCMGGITIDNEGNVLGTDGDLIPGLHAVGEVTGGVHGANRLGGNSLLECTVYGTLVGQKLPVKPRRASTLTNAEPAQSSKEIKLRAVPHAELEQHSTADDCWVAIHGLVYDLTEFADEHPGGAQSVHDLAGTDGTQAFAAVHRQDMLEEFEDDIMGTLLSVSIG